MEYLRKLEITDEGKRRIETDGTSKAIEWTASAIEAEMKKDIDKLLNKISVRDRIIFNMKNST
jgi:hypothetical protein